MTFCLCPILKCHQQAQTYHKYSLTTLRETHYNVSRSCRSTYIYAPILGLQGDMEWGSLFVDRQISIVRFWNRPINRYSDKLTKRILLWDCQLNDNK